MIKISAVARFAAFVWASTLACAFAGAQDDPGPWIPPAGSVAGPSSADFQEGPAPSAGAYPPSQEPLGQAQPRRLAPVYRGPEGAAPAPTSHALPHSGASYPERPFPGRPPEAAAQTAARSTFPIASPATTPPAALPPARGAAPLPPAERSSFEPEFDRGFVASTAFATDVSPESDAASSATGDGEAAKRPLPPKPEPGSPLKSSTGQFPFAATFGSLAAVLGAFFIFVWFQKRGSKRGVGALPPEVVEPLGTIPFVSRQALHVVRFGSKILLINVTAGGSETLAEIDDPREAERILALCRRHRPDPLGRTFREILGSPRPAAAAPSDRSRGAAHA